MVTKRSWGDYAFDIFNNFIMCVLIVVTIYPVLYVLFASLSDASQLIQHSGILLKPLGLNFSSYQLVFEKAEIRTGYLNTIFVVVVGVIVNLLLSSICAYCLSRKNVLWNSFITKMIVVTMFFGGGLVPFYLTIKDLGLYDTRWALIFPSAISTYNMIIMRTSFLGIPDSLEESARIDGAGHMSVLFKIILPLSKSVLAVMVLFYGVAHWNAWFNAMMFLKDVKKYPLQLILRDILIQNQTGDMAYGIAEVERFSVSETIKYATIIVATVPILGLYPFLQKYFQKGVMIGSIKG